MAYSSPQINEILAKTDRTMYKIGNIAYQNMFSELDEALDYHRDIIYIYKKAVEWGDDYFVGTEKLDKIVERLAGMIAVWDYGMLTPIYNDVAGDASSVLPPCYLLEDLCDVNITNVQDGQYLTYDAETDTWINTGPGAAIRYSQSFTATAGQTIFVTSNPFTNGMFDIYVNGVRLNSESYTTFGNYTITLIDPCVAGDIIDITSYDVNGSISSFISLTTTGSTGASTLTGTVLNVPNYGLESISSASVTGTSTKTLTLTKLGGGTVTTSWTDISIPPLTAGSVLFSNGTTIAEDNANFFWDDANNRLGIGTSTPNNALDVIRGVAGVMGRSVYESASFSYDGDMKLGIYTAAASSGLGGASLMFAATNFTAGGYYPGFELQFSPNSTVASNYMRFNYVGRNSTGTVITSVQDIISIFQAGNVVIGSNINAGFKLDVNGTTRIASTVTLSNLAGTGNRMVIANSTGVLSTQAITTGTVTSVDMSIPTGFAISGNPITSSGTLALSFASGYSLPTNIKQGNWDDAYTWVAGFPTQTGNAGKYLTTDGNALSWGTISLTGYVPYTGATGNVDLGEYGISAGYFQTDLSPTQAGGVGRFIWNNQDGTVNLGLLGGNVSLHIGQQQYARVVNGTGGNVLRSNYQVVKIIGAQGQRLQVALARADNDFNSKDSIGLVAENINNNNEGFIISSGLIEEINTTGSLQSETWVDGDTLYLSGTTYGQLTNIKPSAPTHTIIIGFVVYAHANHGKIFVKVDNGYELEELHDVNPLPYVNNGVLYRDTSLNLWKSATIPTVLGYTPVNKAGDTMTGNLILNANPVSALGAATKDYVDTLINGIDWKQSANAATVASLPSYNVTGSGQILTGTANGAIPSVTTDGVTLVAGNRVLVKNETSTLTPNNGIYVVTQAGNGSTPFILTRSDDANSPSEIEEATISINGGSTLSNSQWHCNPASTPVVFGTTYITFAQIGSGVYTAGSGLTLTGNIFSITTNGVTDAMIQSSANWNTAYNNRITSASAPLSITSNSISISQATNSTSGYLSTTDWNTFNNKQDALNGTGFVKISGTTISYDNSTYLTTAITSLNGLTASTQTFTTGTGGTDFGISSAGSTHTFNLPTASATNRGALSSADWSTFNGKQDAITLTTTGTSGAATLVGSTLNIPQYSGGASIGGTVTGGTTGSVLFIGASSALAQDNANFFWDDTNNRLGIGTNAPQTTVHIVTPTSASTVRGLFIEQLTNDANGGTLSFGKKRTSAIVQNTDTLAQIIPHGWDGASYISGGRIRFAVDGVPTTNSVPTAIQFYTGTTGAGSERARFTAAGRLLLGTTTESTFLLDVNGNARIVSQFLVDFQSGTTYTSKFGNTYIQSPAQTNNVIGFNTFYDGTNFKAVSTGVINYIQAALGSFICVGSNASVNAGSTGTMITYFDFNGTESKLFASKLNSNCNTYVDFVLGGGFDNTRFIKYSYYLGGGYSHYLVTRHDSVANSTQNQLTLYINNSTTAGGSSAPTVGNVLSNSNSAVHSAFFQPTLFKTGGAVNDTPVATAAVEIVSTTRGFLPPRMTNTQRQAITTPAAGLIVYSTDTTEGAFVNTSLGWQRIATLPVTTTTASTATLTPNIDAADTFTITAQAAALSVANPTGTPVNGQKMTIRIEDNGTARAITWSGTQYRASTDLALPTTTIATKTMYLGFIYNSTDTKWDLIAFINNF